MKSFIFHTPIFILLILLTACLPVSSSAPPILSGPPGEVVYHEEFADNTSGWDRIANDGGIMDYDSGGYRILVRQPKLNFWSTPEKNFGGVRVEVDVMKLNGPDENRTGLMCRYQHGDYYFFIVSNDGFYAIGKFIGGQTLLLGQEQMQASELILLNSTNHLRADCVGDTLTFYVNFNQVASIQDTDFPTGDVGVLAGSFTQPGVDVLFQNFVVIQP